MLKSDHSSAYSGLKMKKQLLSFLFLVLVLANVCFGDIQIDGYSDATND